MEIATERARGAVMDEYAETPERESVSERFDGLSDFDEPSRPRAESGPAWRQ